MGATNGQGLHNRIGAFRPEPQRPALMAALGGLLIDHRPFVQAETAEERGATSDGDAQVAREGQAGALQFIWRHDAHETIGTTLEAGIH